MPNGKKNGNHTQKKNGRPDAEKQDSIEDEQFDVNIREKLIKDTIRGCVLAGLSNEVIQKYLNSGLLGFKTDNKGDVILDDEQKPTPKTLQRAQYFVYKRRAMSLNEIQQDFTDFVKTDYALEVASVKSMLKILANIMFKAVMSEKNPEKQAKLAHNLFKDMPSYTQFLDISKAAIKHGKLKLEGSNESKTSTLAANH